MPDENQTSNAATLADTATPIVNPAVAGDVPSPIIGTPAPVADGAGAPASMPGASGAPGVPEEEFSTEQTEEEKAAQRELLKDVATRINDAHNILVALSSDPSVDELAAAIGLSLYLDKIGKRATAIYSGTTPNALEFLNPEETFDTDTDVLQDFVIALNKDKADHLRYKLDGDFVKIFITPYKTRIDKDDLEFSYGDFNIDLVLALDVANGTDLDAALREHGRIMHDATIINVTTGNPGKFGEIEWSNKHASSICEMAADLLYGMAVKTPLEAEEATALLTGVIAATDRFSNTKTTPDTMQVASKLMESGADQQLITQNIADTENNFFNIGGLSAEDKKDNDPTSLAIDHEEDSGDATEVDSGDMHDDGELSGVDDTQSEAADDLPDLSAVAASLTASENGESASLGEDVSAGENAASDAAMTGGISAGAVLAPSADFMNEVVGVENKPETVPEVKAEKVIAAPEGFAADTPSETGKKYSQMLEDALSEGGAAPMVTNPAEAAPIVSDAGSMNPGLANGGLAGDALAAPMPANPAVAAAPVLNENTEINGVPAINYSVIDADEALPPPPAPPIDLNSPVPPEMVDNGVGVPGSSVVSGVSGGSSVSGTGDSGAFQIPGAA